MIQSLVSLITSLFQGGKQVKNLLSGFNSIFDFLKKSGSEDALKKAINQAKEEKDTSGLEEVFSSMKKP